MEKVTSWRKSFKLWSNQVFVVIAALGVLQWGPEAVAAMTGTLPLWKSILPSWAFAAISTGLAFIGPVLRNLRQRNVDTD